MKSDKANGKHLFATPPLQNYPINQRETFEPHGYKPFNTGSYNSFTERSNDEENIENYKFMDELSNKDKEYA